jgi:hypothetical protein
MSFVTPILKAETCNNYHNYLSLLKGQKYHSDEYIYLKGRCRGRRKNVQLNDILCSDISK